MIQVKSKTQIRHTQVPNEFIDHYMPYANGEFVKVYLLLLRSMASEDHFLSLEDMADRLQCTEKDLLRALTYWEAKKLLALSYNSAGEITGIIILPFGSLAEEASSVPSEISKKASSPSDGNFSEKTAAARARKNITSERLSEMQQNAEVSQLLRITEKYFNKLLTPTEIRTIVYFYDELQMSAELIEYLIEYSVSRGHKSMRYIETVALNWKKDGITTVAAAQKASEGYGKEYYQILKALGITNRSPIPDEVRMMDLWRKDYDFDLSIIEEACRRTILATGQGSFPYTDSILSNWSRQGVHTLSDIAELDKQRESQKRAGKTKTAVLKKEDSSNRFSNFSQRDYNFEQMEQALLGQTCSDPDTK